MQKKSALKQGDGGMSENPTHSEIDMSQSNRSKRQLRVKVNVNVADLQTMKNKNFMKDLGSTESIHNVKDASSGKKLPALTQSPNRNRRGTRFGGNLMTPGSSSRKNAFAMTQLKSPEQIAAQQKRRNTILMMQNRERLALKNTLQERIKKLQHKKQLQKILTKEADLLEFMDLEAQGLLPQHNQTESSSEESFEIAPDIVESESNASRRQSSATRPSKLVTDEGFLDELRKTIRGSKKKHQRTPSAQARNRHERDLQLRSLMAKDKVIVFARNVLHPWDDVPRFDFLDCNLKQVMNEGEPFSSAKKPLKDTFIGNINQLKPQQAKGAEKKNVSTFDQQLQEHKEKYRNLVKTGPTKPKGKKLQKPQTESGMKGLIDLYKVINDTMYTRVQDQIPNSECIGLTKEQRTRMASMETRSDANKAMYYKIQHELLEKEKEDQQGISRTDAKILAEASKIIDMQDKISGIVKADSKIREAESKASEEHQRKQLITGKTHAKFSMQEMTQMMLRAKLKEKLFQEKLATHVELARRKLDFEIIKDNYENKVTQEILDRFADTSQGMPGTAFKYQKIQSLMEQRKNEVARLREEERLERQMQRELARTRSSQAKKAIELKYEARKTHSQQQYGYKSSATLTDKLVESANQQIFFE